MENILYRDVFYYFEKLNLTKNPINMLYNRK